MIFSCSESHPYRNFIEYINATDETSLIEDFLQYVSVVEFGGNTSADLNKITLQDNDLKELYSHLKNDEFLHLIIHRYINAIKMLLVNNNVNQTEIFLRLGEFRERTIEHFSRFDETEHNDFAKMFGISDPDLSRVNKQKKRLAMESQLSNIDLTLNREEAINRMCALYFENNNDSSHYGKASKQKSDSYTNRVDDPSIIKSLVIPKMNSLSNIDDLLINRHRFKQKGNVYLNANKFYGHIKNLLVEKLEHHINRLGDNGIINKNKVYSKYGVTPYLLGSTKDSSAEVREYDTDLKSIEKHLHIDQVIIISYLMYLRYATEGSEDSKDKEIRQLHQLIKSPYSQFTIPQDLINIMKKTIRSYAKETVLSNNIHDNTDEELVTLIEIFLNSRLSVPTLNDFNNFSILMEDIKDNVHYLVTEGSDYNSFLKLDELLHGLQSTYNTWLKKIKMNDKEFDYVNNFSSICSRILTEDDSVYSLHETTYIKERFQALIDSSQ